MDNKSYFAIDDFDEIYENYFKGISMWEALDADVSYWYNITSKAIDILQIEGNAQYYRSDYSKGLSKEKEKILYGLSQWESFDIHPTECTLCTSATMASLIVLTFLKRIGIQQIIFETPCYFASLIQAKLLGFEIILIPTYYSDHYSLKIREDIFSNNKKKSIWLSQPRFALGINQNANYISDLYKHITNNDFIIIDEANEHIFPSPLRSLQPHSMSRIIRFKSLFKPLGLNGPRISCIFHNREYRSLFQDAMDVMQGGIDYNSIALAVDLYSHPNILSCALERVHRQIIDLKQKAEIITQWSNIELSPLENGYLGALHIHYNNDLTIEQNRHKLLTFCKKIEMPVILGASMYYATEPNIEHIRLNYFIHDSLFLNGIESLAKHYSL